MKEVLVVASQTLGAQNLQEEMRRRIADGGARMRFVIPQFKPSAGLVIYDEAVRDAAQVRLDLTLSIMASVDIEATGEVGDPDPYSATMDAVSEHRPDEIIVSTLPAQSSGWLRRDLIERIQGATGLPVTHVVSDIEHEKLPFLVTLVIASKTAGGDELVERLKAKKAEHDERHLFVAVVPQQDGGGAAAQVARERLAKELDRLRDAGLLASGMIGDPDPFTATLNALELFRVDDVVISTLPDERSGWMRSDLIERVQRATTAPVEHVVVDQEAASAAAGG